MLKQGKSCYLMMIVFFFLLFIKLFFPSWPFENWFLSYLSAVLSPLHVTGHSLLVVWEDGKRCVPPAPGDGESKDEVFLHVLE